ncbi:Knotted 1-binding protein [Quillaja saponaria]|uniref:Knotted 1-binding protein n=1 Tax=Quillaja saponaria TaxID=32244 RepID=A0AAD7Q1K1_QUISA|nr:Knotted 1-binding protein [Quillaja saponaria]
MESSGTEAARKRMKPDTEEKEGDEADSRVVEKEEFETTITGFEEMELNISHMLEKIQQFTQMGKHSLRS